MKQSEKIKISISSTGVGSYSVRVEWPNGRQHRQTVGYSLFGKAISITKRLDSQFSDGAFDFYLTDKQYTKYLTRLVDNN